MTNRQLSSVVTQYLHRFPGERDRLSRLRHQLDDNQDVFNRKNYMGHVTASAIVLPPMALLGRLLMVHHRALGKWVAPSGHMEVDDREPFYAAQRELKEEVGLDGTYLAQLKAKPAMPFDIDTHFIPANPAKGEEQHWHHDFRYAFVGHSLNITLEDSALSEAKWVAYEAPEAELLQSAISKLALLES